MPTGTATTHVASPWPRNFHPLPNNFGLMLQCVGAEIGTGGVALTGTATTTVYITVPSSRTFSVVGAAMQGPTAAAGGSTITAQLIRNNAGTAVTLTAANSITTSFFTADCTDWPITPASPSNNLCNPGDTLRWEVVAATTVTTAPQLVGEVEIAVVR